MKVPERGWLAGRLRGVAAGMLVTLAAPPAAVAGPAYEVCAAQIRTLVRERFGHTPVHIEFRFDHQHWPIDAFDDAGSDDALVEVAECPGYHWFELHAGEYQCRFQAHYGTPPRYAYYRSSGGGC